MFCWVYFLVRDGEYNYMQLDLQRFPNPLAHAVLVCLYLEMRKTKLSYQGIKEITVDLRKKKKRQF